MYRSHYGLTLKPFQISSDPKFLWLGEKHQEALAILKYGVLDNRGFLLLTGDVGTGKTTLINALVNSLGPDTLVAHVPDPGLEVIDFFNYIASTFRMGQLITTKGDFLLRFREFLEKAFTKQRQVLLIIDEAQRLDATVLEEIRLLSNIEHPQNKLLNIFFVGQNEFIDILSRNENRALLQRMTLNYHIDPLTEEETQLFIQHRLKVAGTEKKIFNLTAVSEIYAFSGGYPRLMNIICDHALLTGYVKGVKTIDGEMIAECAKELRLQKKPVVTAKPIPEGMPLPVSIPHPAAVPANVSGATPPPTGRSRSWVKRLGVVVAIGLVGAFLYTGENMGGWKRLDRLIDQIDFMASGKVNSPVVPDQKNTVTLPVPQPTKPMKESIPDDSLSSTQVSSSNQDALTVSPVKAEGSILQSSESKRTVASNPPMNEEKSVSVAPLPTHLVIRFGYNSNDLLPEAYETLDRLAIYLKETPATTIAIKGYTDNAGNPGYNLSLSGFRANIVKNYLMGHGISALRMTVKGFGSENPLKNNNTPEGRETNRRVEIELQKH